jgi:stage II sporulation protein D
MHRFRPLAVLLSVLFLISPATPVAAEKPEEATIECEQVFVEACPSHSSGGRPELGRHLVGNPTEVVTLLRVGLRTTTFNATGGVLVEQAAHDHAAPVITGTAGDFHVVDLTSGKQIAAPASGQEVRVAFVSGAYEVRVNGAVVGSVAGPVRFRASDPANTFKVLSIRRSLWTSLTARALGIPDYYGEIEIARGPSTAAGMVNVVNVVPLEPYVRGVVVNESIATFHVEALKAQAAAARGYALANKDSTRFGRPYGVDDTTASQVYRGKGSEHPNGNAAVSATESLVASHLGTIITAFYSSSMGGHTENNEWIFNSPASQLPGTNAEPYLRGIYDGDGGAPDFSSETAIAAFWSARQAATFDSCPRVNNRFDRWNIDIDAGTLKSRILVPLRSVLISGDTGGTVTGVQIVQRMAASKRAAVVRVTLSSGVVEVRGWDNVRRVVGTSVGSKPWPCTTPGSTIAANFVLNNPSVIEELSSGGVFTGIRSYGGGWGHNVGMSQFGAHGRGLAGQSFVQILKGYYSGVDVGAYPIDIRATAGGGPRQLKQRFASPNGTGRLRIVASGGMKGLTAHVNDACDLRFTESQLAAGPIEVDITPCLVTGSNLIHYNPSGSGMARVQVLID